ncbi:secretion-regulating guanine nucleotide exchange factor [Cyanistes caeruleus]|uniref:secretion-regulating guanine nucleotide exchange factor n=1 Tax=Cyanistes caeruleus TaxID=156563 RepID=UPI000CDA3E9D|nr:secretion-regulating guanine nucleotide exchange factor [Cyanistes caeruleus]
MASQAKRASQGKALPLFLTAKEPCEVAGLEDVNVKEVAAGSYHSVSLTGMPCTVVQFSLPLFHESPADGISNTYSQADEGHLFVWGSNKHGQLVSGDIFLAEPKKIDTQCFSHEKIGAVWSGWTHLVAQTEAGKVFTWGRVHYGQLGRHVVVPDGQQSTAAEECFLELLCNTPVSVPCLNGASQIACGSEHNLAIVGRTHFLDSLQTVWSANTPLFKDLKAFSCMEKQHFRKHIMPPSAAKDAVPGNGASPGRRMLSRTSVALLALPARGQQSLDGLWVHKGSGVGYSY